MSDFTEDQKKCINYYKLNLKDWLAEELKRDKYVVISDETIKGIYDTIDMAFDYAVNNLPKGSYIIQRIVDENAIVNFIRAAVVLKTGLVDGVCERKKCRKTGNSHNPALFIYNQYSTD